MFLTEFTSPYTHMLVLNTYLLVEVPEFNVFIVTDDPGSKPDHKYSRRRDRQNYMRKYKGAKIIPLCVQNICTLGRCRLQGCWYAVYDGACHAAGFGLLLAKSCDSVAALTSCKQKYLLKFSAHINRAALCACSGIWSSI